MHGTTVPERRQYERYDFNQTALLQVDPVDPDRLESVEVRNISQGGIFIFSRQLMNVGQTVQMFLSYDNLDKNNNFNNLLPQGGSLYFKLTGEVIRIEDTDPVVSLPGLALKLTVPVTLEQKNLHVGIQDSY